METDLIMSGIDVRGYTTGMIPCAVFLFTPEERGDFMQPWNEDGAGTRVVVVTYDGLVKPTSFCSFGIPLCNTDDFANVYNQLPTAHAKSMCNCGG